MRGQVGDLSYLARESFCSVMNSLVRRRIDVCYLAILIEDIYRDENQALFYAS